MAHRGGRIIGTDTLRVSPVVQVSSDHHEREQDSNDNPNINAHQRSPAAALPLSVAAVYAQHFFDRLYVAPDRKSSIGSRRIVMDARFANVDPPEPSHFLPEFHIREKSKKALVLDFPRTRPPCRAI